MIIGHLPAGYLMTRYLIKRQKLPLTKFWLGLGLFASIIPDLDYIYWLLLKNPADTHRVFLTSHPFIYICLFLVCLVIGLLSKKAWLKNFFIIVFGNMFLHFILDTTVYGLKWLYPFSNQFIGIYNVGSYENGIGLKMLYYYSSWYWYLEMALWIAAIISVIYSYKKGDLKSKI